MALGRLFSFMASDVAEKTNILLEHIERDASSQNYCTINSMLNFEVREGIVHRTIYTRSADGTLPSGSRTLLRLHRALQFVIRFIDGVRRSAETDRMAPVAKAGYDGTLGQYHSWLIRQGSGEAEAVPKGSPGYLYSGPCRHA
ncbi:unnamed protein product [Soboliphyme baturini]|uniref:GLTP domain-containing protein n=1 Tax=Soboliphyme baturini TaxID=241478 RepID=A0A183J774_9BILA|nr:unnamed protein product [Soboliphyme baturini]